MQFTITVSAIYSTISVSLSALVNEMCLSLMLGVYIEFLTEFGDLPMLIPDVTLIDSYAYGLDDYRNTYIMNVTEYQKGMQSTVTFYYDTNCR